MFSNPITATTLTVSLEIETIRDGCAQARGRLSNEAYAQT